MSKKEKDKLKIEGQLELLEALKHIPVEVYSIKPRGGEKQYYLGMGFIEALKINLNLIKKAND